MTAFEYLNTASCALLMGYTGYVAAVMPHKGMWLKRLMVGALAAILLFQILGSLRASGVAPIAWHGALLHATLALCLLVWRKEAITFIKCRFTIPDETFIPKRKTDTIDLTDPQLRMARGRGKESL